MPKLPSIPRLSIVIPICGDLAAFETTLISVLENRPAGCEVLVANDGSYDDPFDLCDEVRFVVGPSDHFVDLVAAGAAESRGRFVHVLADGMQATAGWIDAALEKFENFDVASIAPVIRHRESGAVLSAGWRDSASRLCDPIRRLAKARQGDAGASCPLGAYLPASMWRREVLRSLGDAYAGKDALTASYAYEFLLRSAGWRCALAEDSALLCETQELPWDHTSALRGKQLRAIRSHFDQQTNWRHTAAAAARSLLINAASPALWAESLGQLAAPALAVKTQQMIHSSAVKVRHDEPEQQILRMPVRHARRQRRAA